MEAKRDEMKRKRGKGEEGRQKKKLFRSNKMELIVASDAVKCIVSALFEAF